MPERLTSGQLTWMLSIALVEIRAIEELAGAQALADIFHNVPNTLQNGMEPDEIYRQMRECAERHKMAKSLDALRDQAIKRKL